MKAIWAILAILMVIFYLWVLQVMGKPHFQHPDMTSEQQAHLKWAIKYHGNYPIERVDEEGTWIMRRNKEIIKL